MIRLKQFLFFGFSFLWCTCTHNSNDNHLFSIFRVEYIIVDAFLFRGVVNGPPNLGTRVLPSSVSRSIAYMSNINEEGHKASKKTRKIGIASKTTNTTDIIQASPSMLENTDNFKIYDDDDNGGGKEEKNQNNNNNKNNNKNDISDNKNTFDESNISGERIGSKTSAVGASSSLPSPVATPEEKGLCVINADENALVKAAVMKRQEEQKQQKNGAVFRNQKYGSSGAKSSAVRDDDTRNLNRFRRHLRNIPRYIRNKKTLANYMDYELKQMEIKYYNLTKSSRRNGSSSQKNGETQNDYRGPTIQPDVLCYDIVAKAYAKSYLGRTGVKLAEKVLQRCERYLFNIGNNTNRLLAKTNTTIHDVDDIIYDQNFESWTILQASRLNVWARADDWNKADKIMNVIEKQIQQRNHNNKSYLQTQTETHQREQKSKEESEKINQDARNNDNLGISVYNSYIEGLSKSNVLDCREIETRSNRIFTKLNSSGPRPDRNTYISYMKCLGRKRGRRMSGINGYREILAIVRELETAYRITNDPMLKPNLNCYLPVFSIAARCGGGIQAAKEAELLLNELKPDPNNGDYSLRVDFYTLCFTAYARVLPQHAKESSEAVDRLLQSVDNEMNSKKKHSENSIFRPSLQMYTAAINGKVLYRSLESIQIAEALLQRLKKPDPLAYKCVIRAYAKMGHPMKAEKLLWKLCGMDKECNNKNEIRSNKNSKDLDIQQVPVIDPVTIDICIRSWMELKDENGTKNNNINLKLDHINKLFHFLNNVFRQRILIQKNRYNVRGRVTPEREKIDGSVYEDVMHLWSISRRRDAGGEVEKIIDSMNELHEQLQSLPPINRGHNLFYPYPSFKPTFHHYVLALDTWTTSVTPTNTAAGKGIVGENDQSTYDKNTDAEKHHPALQLLTKMRDLYHRGELDHDLNMRALSSALSSISKSSPFSSSFSLHYYNSTAVERGRVKSSIDICMELFDQMLYLKKEGDRSARVDGRTTSGILKLIIKAQQASGESLDNDNDMKRFDDAIQFLEKLRNASIELNEKGIAPNTIAYNCVLNGLAIHGMGDRAHKLLHRMEQYDSCLPDVVSYSCVCRAYSKSVLSCSKSILARNDENSNITCNNNSPYSNTCKKVESILEKVEKVYYEKHDKKMKPDVGMYNAALVCFANTARKMTTDDRTCDPGYNIADRANAILRRMEMSVTSRQQNCNNKAHHLMVAVPPDIITYGIVCQIHAYSGMPNAIHEINDILDRSKIKRNLTASGANTSAIVAVPCPDIVFYKVLIDAFVQNSNRYNGTGIEPLYSADQLLRRMTKEIKCFHQREGVHNVDKSNRIQPKSNIEMKYVYNIVLASWAKSKYSGKLNKAYKILQEMEADGTNDFTLSSVFKGSNLCVDNRVDIRPNADSYNWVILAAARSPSIQRKESDERFLIALECFQNIHKKKKHQQNEGKGSAVNAQTMGGIEEDVTAMQPNANTYLYFSFACKSLLKNRQTLQKYAIKIFLICIQNGFLSEFVWREIAGLLPAHVVNGILQRRLSEQHQVQKVNNNNKDNIPPLHYSLNPPEWSRNVIRKGKRNGNEKGKV